MLRYTLIPTRPQPWYRAVLPWDEYLELHHQLRAKVQHQLMGLINYQMRQTGDGNAYLHLQHAEFVQIKDLELSRPKVTFNESARSTHPAARRGASGGNADGGHGSAGQGNAAGDARGDQRGVPLLRHDGAAG